MPARNLLIPFRRDRKRDFAVGEDEALLGAKVRQVLLTEGATPGSAGELPWRTNFGAGLGQLRHKSNDAVLSELARVRVRDALKRWLPSVEVLEVLVAPKDESLTVRVRVREGVTTTVVSTP